MGSIQIGLLWIRQVPPVAAHETEQPAILSTHWILLLPQPEEVLIDQADDAEAVGHDLGVGEVLAHDLTVGFRQIRGFALRRATETQRRCNAPMI
jgi:hypothetical protein